MHIGVYSCVEPALDPIFVILSHAEDNLATSVHRKYKYLQTITIKIWFETLLLLDIVLALILVS